MTGDEAKRLAARVLYNEDDAAMLKDTLVAGLVTPLPFYKTVRFYNLKLRAGRGGLLGLFVLANDESVYILDIGLHP